MKDYLHRALQWIDHNRYLFICMLVAFAISVGMFAMVGCQSTTTGVVTPEPVTRVGLEQQAAQVQKALDSQWAGIEKSIADYNADVMAYGQAFDVAEADLDRKDEMKRQVFTGLAELAQSAAAGGASLGTVIPTTVGLIGVALGVGAMGDSKRKDIVIKAKSDEVARLSGTIT